MTRKWNELSVLIAGCGSIAKRHARVLRGLGVSDLRACDPSPAAREALAAETPSVKLYDAFEAGLAAGPQTVLLCTPTSMHVPMATRALEAGCHVLTEKPLADTSEGVDALAEAARREGRKVMVAFCFRYHEGVLEARRIVRSGRLGRLVSIRALMGENLPEVRRDYRTMDTALRMGVFEQVHDVDLAVWLADLPIRSVRCVFGNYSDVDIPAPDLAEILIDFDGPCVAAVHLDFFQRPRRRQLELLCGKGVVLLEFARWDRCTVSVYDVAAGAWEHEEMPTDRDDMFRAEDTEFLRAVAEDLPVSCTIEEGRKSLEVIAAARAGQR